MEERLEEEQEHLVLLIIRHFTKQLHVFLLKVGCIGVVLPSVGKVIDNLLSEFGV